MADSRKSTIFPYFTKYSILSARLLTHKHTNSRLFYPDNEIKISQKLFRVERLPWSFYWVLMICDCDFVAFYDQ